LIKKGSPFDVSFSVVNKGSSPFYYDWPVEISLLDSKTHEVVWTKVLEDVKISEWLPGDKWNSTTNSYREEAKVYTVNRKLVIDNNIDPGEYIIAISILDPSGMLPSVRFATRNYFNGGRHPMGKVGVDKSIDNYIIESKLFDDIASDLSLKYVIEK
jgi:hypothetical protein